MKENYTKNVFLSLGSNLGNKFKNLIAAAEAVQKFIGPLEHASSLLETEAWGNKSQEAFLNQVIQVQTKLTPPELLQEIHRIESAMGRVRKEKWEPRIIDLDILYYDDQVLSSSELEIPHPYLAQRKFVLAPLAEIAPNFKHPILKKTNRELLDECADESAIRFI